LPSLSEPAGASDADGRYEDRRGREQQNGRSKLTPRQQRQIRKTALRLEHGRHRTHVDQVTAERATKGWKRAYADWLRDFYRSQLRGMRRRDHRAKLGRYTAGRG
jgi:hypothetical protein